MIYADEIITTELMDKYITRCLGSGERATLKGFCSWCGFARTQAGKSFTQNSGVAPGVYISRFRNDFIRQNRHLSAIDLSIQLGISTTQVWARAKDMGIRMGGK